MMEEMTDGDQKPSKLPAETCSPVIEEDTEDVLLDAQAGRIDVGSWKLARYGHASAEDAFPASIEA